MASGMVASRPSSRPTSCAGIKMNLPVIAHPRANMASQSADLSIRGESRMGQSPMGLEGMGRMQTFVSLDRGHMQTGLDRSNLPPLTERTGMTSPAPSLIRMSLHGNPGDATVRNLGDKGKYRRSISEVKKYDEDEIYMLVQEKLTTSYHGLKHLFKSNDSSGKGVVTREALLKILYSLIGHVTVDKYHKFLKGLNLSDRPQISFDLFVSRFGDNETVAKEWVSPFQKMDLHAVQANQHPEEHLRFVGVSNKKGFISAAYCHAQLRDKARSRAINVSELLPGSCTEPGAMILAPHLKNIIDSAGLKVTVEEFSKLWQRYDVHGVGAVKTTLFFHQIGLDEFGFPRPQTVPKCKVMEKVTEHAQSRQPHAKSEASKSPSKVKPQMVAESKEEKENTDQGKEEEKQPDQGQMVMERRSLMSRKLRTPKLEKIVDCLACKFEEPYSAMLAGMQCFDFLSDGLISKVDMKRVLTEFSLPVSSIELDHFLSRCSVRTMRGQVPYKDFLMKFWNRSESGMVNRIVTNSTHLFGQDSLPVHHGNQLTVEELEARFIDYLHGDFLRLLGSLKKMDKYSIGVVTQHEFKYAVERTLGYKLTDKQWLELKETVGLDADGLVPYPKFLERFNTSPGSWNKREVGGFKVTQVNQVDLPSAVARLKQEALREQEEREAIDAHAVRLREEEERLREERRKQREKQEIENEGDGRSLQELSEILQGVFRTNFHAIDQAFKALDRRMTGRFAKHQLADLISEGGVHLKPCEVDVLWDSFRLGSDGLFNFTTMVRHFTEYGKVVENLPPAVEPKPPPPDGFYEIRLGQDERPYHGKYSYAYCNVDPKYDPYTVETSKPQQIKPVKENFCSDYGNGPPTKPRREHHMDKSPCEKITAQVLARWDKLKAIFQHLDKAGQAKILAIDMKEILVHMRFGLSNKEVEYILAKYDQNNDGHFHYIEFLKSYIPTKGDENDLPFNRHTFKMERKKIGSAASWQIESPTITQIIDRVRCKLIKEHKTIRRAFKKADSSNTGLLSVTDFKNVLKSCNVQVSGEDLYHLLTEFDSKMNGTISYEDFLSTMLSTV